MGGGDVKLLTALALWIEPTWFLRLLIGMALIGGVLTLAMGAWHVMRRRKNKLAIPYGVAISAAGIWVIAAQVAPVFQATGAVGNLG
jgi:prepilin peptidase CpaA